MPLKKSTYYTMLKLGIAGMCGFFLYKRTLHFKYSEIEALFQNCFATNWGLLTTALLLVFCNWGIEAIKWKYLIRNIEKLTFFRAFGAVMAGVTVSSFTPNRVGEFAGRMMLLTRKLDIRVIGLTIIGGMSQLFITLCIGFPCLVFFLTFNYPAEFIYRGIIIGFGALGLLVYAGFFFNLPYVYRQINLRFAKQKRIKFISAGLAYVDGFGLRYITALSMLRYLIFCCQYGLVLMFFDLHTVWFWQAFGLIPVVFLIQSVVPTYFLTELGVRATVALAVFSFAGLGDVQIMAASALLWVINLMIPAITGVFIILFSKLKNETPR